MSRNLSEVEVNQCIGRDESSLAQQIRIGAQMRALSDTGIKTDVFVRKLNETTQGIISPTETKPR